MLRRSPSVTYLIYIILYSSLMSKKLISLSKLVLFRIMFNKKITRARSIYARFFYYKVQTRDAFDTQLVTASFDADGRMDAIIVDGQSIPLRKSLMWYAGMGRGVVTFPCNNKLHVTLFFKNNSISNGDEL